MHPLAPLCNLKLITAINSEPGNDLPAAYYYGRGKKISKSSACRLGLFYSVTSPRLIVANSIQFMTESCVWITLFSFARNF